MMDMTALSKGTYQPVKSQSYRAIYKKAQLQRNNIKLNCRNSAHQTAESQAPAQPPVQSKTKTTSLDPIEISQETDQNSIASKVAAPAAVIAGLVLILGLGYAFKDEIQRFLDFFVHAVENWGPWGYVAYGAVYTGLEILAVPAIPLTMTAGPIFGVVQGTAIVSVSATLAATIAFVIARYVARDKIQSIAAKNPKWAAIDRAIGKNGFKVVTLLRLSPLLPLALSNYLYGLTAVELRQYVLGSWLGMLPGTFAYVSAGYYGVRLVSGDGNGGLPVWQILVGAGFTVLGLWYIAKVATDALQQENLTEDSIND